MPQLEYLKDQNGNPKALVIPIDLWNRFFLKNDFSENELSDAVEEYCLNKAMDEAKQTPLSNREEALNFLGS